MPYKLNKIRNITITPRIAAYEVVGDFPAPFCDFVAQILRMENAYEVIFSLPRDVSYRRWGPGADCTMRMERGEPNGWWPADDNSSDWYNKLSHETVVYCTAHGSPASRCYSLELASLPQGAAPEPQRKSGTQKVKVRFTSDYSKYPKESLVAMLHDRDELIGRLQFDLAGAREQEQLWKSEAAKLSGENRTLKANARSTGAASAQPAPAKTASAPERPKEPPRSLIEGPCFHGECWYKCPYCGKGVEAHSLKRTARKDVFLCPYCRKEVLDSY